MANNHPQTMVGLKPWLFRSKKKAVGASTVIKEENHPSGII